MLKDKNFFNRESLFYSNKRYPKKASNYVQFFFKQRLKKTLEQVINIYKDKLNLNLLEIGCADGVVLRYLQQNLENNFSKIVGIDIAEDMIGRAREMNNSGRTSFFIRGEEPNDEKFDLILELGVINYTDFEIEMKYALDKLNSNGLYFLSVAGDSSLSHYFRGGEEQFKNFYSYGKYENTIKKYFFINKIIPVGFYLPLIWKIPKLALFIQSILEKIFSIFPNLYHEKIYILKPKS